MLEFFFDKDGEYYTCSVTKLTKPLPMLITGTGYGDCEPPEDGEFEFEILTESGEITDLPVDNSLFDDLYSQACILSDAEYYEP